MVEEADLVIAEASYPSIGLGIELQIAEARGIPLIICHERSEAKRSQSKFYENPDRKRHELQIGDGFVSLMALGLPNLLSVLPYSEERELITEIHRLVKALN